MKVKSIFVIIIIGLQILGCKKAIEIDPPISGLVSSTVYSSDATSIAALTSIYERLMGETNFLNGTQGIALRLGLSADEFKLYSSDINLSQFYTNSLVSTNSTFWNELYNFVYSCNVAIEQLSNSTSVSSMIKQQLLGEAKFMRAFFYFYLVNIYGDVPLLLTSDYRINSIASRTPKAQVIQQMIADLKEAQNLLTSNYLGADLIASTSERTRPNKWAANALLSRVYLYNGDWANAEDISSTLINNTTMYSLVSNLNNVFLKNSSEAIFQLQPVKPSYNTLDGNSFILTSNPGISSISPVSLSSSLVGSFDTTDLRLAKWVGNYNGYYYANKYKIKGPTTAPVSEYYMVLRLAEQYLIRAEARVQQNNISGAQSDLNIIRSRAGLTNTTAATKASMLTAINRERQLELFAECGHRWLDIKRTNTIDVIMTSIASQKGAVWNSNMALLPVPLDEINKDPNLVQNPGY